jgi:hypothetical protein
MRRWMTLAGLALIGLPGCGASGSDGPPLKGAFTSVVALALPPRNTGPCPPGQTCPPPNDAPQYEVNATLQLRAVSADPAAVTSFTAQLFDARANQIATPQAWSMPAVPFSVAATGMELSLSFLTTRGVEVAGGSVGVIVSGVDAKGERWELAVSAPVPR